MEGNITSVFGIVGNFGYRMDSSDDFGIDTDFSQLNAMGGPRFIYRRDKFRVLAHALFGISRSSLEQEVDDVEFFDISNTDFAMAFRWWPGYRPRCEFHPPRSV